MHHEKKTSMEDTWSAAELKRLLSRRKEPERDRRQHRGGESVERRHRDSRGDRDHRDRHGERRDSHTEERRGEQHRRTERERLEDADRRARDSREDRDKRDRGGPKEGHDGEWDTIKRKEKERRREERERRRHEERREDRDRRERHEDRKLSRDEREQYRKEKEDRERRRKERADHDEKPRRAREDGAEEERAERERRKERRRREDDFETHHGSSRESKGGHRHDTRTTKAEEDVMRSGNMAAKGAGDAQDPVAKDEPSHEYEDDFEDYEEDFEELDEDGGEEDGDAEVGEDVKAIQRAMGEENERVRTSVSALSKEEEEEEKPERSRAKPSDEKASRSSQRGRFIDFVAAKRREVSKKVAMKQKKRSAELLRLIDLDFSTTFSLLELPPVSEYDMYIRNFGAANTKQAYVQCNEENADRDVQTEEVELSDKWTQHPAERSGACGDPNQSHESGNMSGMNFDSRRLTKFLCAASQVMSVLLEEDHAERSSSQGRTAQKDALSFSDGSLQLHTALPFLRGRAVSQLLFSQVQRHKLLSVHEASSSTGDVTPHHGCAVICVWNMWEPSTPQKILLCESEVQCCCFSPGKATLVFAGTRDGSVALWDLREPDGNHHRLKVGGDEWTFRRPTFSTDAVPSAHFSAVTSVEVVPASVSGGPGSEAVFLASEEELLGLSFQLASMDENGLLNLWVVVQLPKGNEAGSQTDLGLRPGGKVKLLHSSACVTAKRVSPSHADKTGPPQSLHVKFLPTDPSHFFLGTNMGLVSHGTTQGLKALPKCYSSRQFATRLVDVTAIQFSPFRPHLFLVGCSDGTVRLHEVSRDKPAAEWTDGTAGKEVVSVQWSQTRPAVFCVLDAASRLHIWDLLKSDAAPVVTEEMDTDRLTAVAAFGDAGQQNTYSGIATAHRSGKIEMHYFTREFTMQKAHEENALEAKVVESF
ncbi:cytoplasmic dynein 2 intermediate chain 1 isoform X2 [Syngnathoides biaculeatus]|uniref:cytoplasmic dynein 2 intermediate chain 1 isoform X2 n=1 Tax=Syngnathoides biaculeatus TaxID=300417 RepID=UPI002ADE4B45|nr:cytoplasmic dynein 2 intermediate chain 1 isoform X2 [Syngnathoides biaculeatus]